MKAPTFADRAIADAHEIFQIHQKLDGPRNKQRLGAMLDILHEIWLQCPDMRLGQLLVNVLTRQDHALTENELFNLTDVELEAKLVAWFQRTRA